MKRIIIIAFILAAATATAQIGHWEKLNPKNNPGTREVHGLAGIGKNKALLFGGITDGKFAIDTWIFDLDNNEWLEIDCKNRPTNRKYFDMEQISENKVLLFGGVGDDDVSFNDLWCFDLDSLNWYEIIPNGIVPIEPTYFHRIAKLNEKEVLVYGGYNDNYVYPSDKTYIYNIEKNEWDNKCFYVDGIGRYNAYFSSLDSNLILMYGGYPYNPPKSDYTWIFDRKVKRWEKAQLSLPEKLNYALGDLVQLFPGCALLFGGEPWQAKSPKYPNDFTWIFNNNKKNWEMLTVDIHPSGRAYNKMAKINEENILLYGGDTEIKSNALETWLFVIDTNITSVVDNNKNKSKFSINYITDDEINYEINCVNPFKISLVNINGITLYSEEKVSIDNISNTSVIPIDRLPSGVYFVVVNTGAEVLCEKVVIY